MFTVQSLGLTLKRSSEFWRTLVFIHVQSILESIEYMTHNASTGEKDGGAGQGYLEGPGGGGAGEVEGGGLL